jgi:hypothetical protein
MATSQKSSCYFQTNPKEEHTGVCFVGGAPAGGCFLDVIDDGTHIEIIIKGQGFVCSPYLSDKYRTEMRFNIFEGCVCVPAFVYYGEYAVVEVEGEDVCPLHSFALAKDVVTTFGGSATKPAFDI